jgi:hypothetical protein
MKHAYKLEMLHVTIVQHVLHKHCMDCFVLHISQITAYFQSILFQHCICG